MQYYSSTYFTPTSPLLPPSTLGLGQISTFSEHGHVAYQIKGNDECSNMQANILLKGQSIFVKVVILHIELMVLEYTALCKHIFCPYTHPRSLGWVQKDIFLLKVVMSHIKLKEWSIDHHANTYCPYTHPKPPGGVKRSKHFF